MGPAAGVVDICLIPEVEFSLEKLGEYVEKLLAKKGHTVRAMPTSRFDCDAVAASLQMAPRCCSCMSAQHRCLAIATAGQHRCKSGFAGRYHASIADVQALQLSWCPAHFRLHAFLGAYPAGVCPWICARDVPIPCMSARG